MRWSRVQTFSGWDWVAGWTGWRAADMPPADVRTGTRQQAGLPPEADVQNASFESWCRERRGRQANEEL